MNSELVEVEVEGIVDRESTKRYLKAVALNMSKSTTSLPSHPLCLELEDGTMPVARLHLMSESKDEMIFSLIGVNTSGLYGSVTLKVGQE